MLPVTARRSARACDSEQVIAEPRERRLLFDRASGPNEPRPTPRLVEEIRHQMSQTLDPEEPFQTETCVAELVGDLLGSMEVRRREPVRIPGRVAVLAFAEVAVDDLYESRVVEVAVDNGVEQRGEPGDHGDGDDSARSNNASSLAEGLDPVPPLGQVIEGSKHQHRIPRDCVFHERTRVTERRGVVEPESSGPRNSLLYVERYRVDEMRPIAALGEPR